MKFTPKDWFLVIGMYIAIGAWWHGDYSIKTTMPGYASIMFFYLAWICEILLKKKSDK